MENAETYRLFVAMTLPEEVKAEIEKVQAELKLALPKEMVRWTKREQFHLTLKFLGNVETSAVDSLKSALRRVCEPFSAMRLRAERIGFFPDLRFPRVIWAWVHDEKEFLPKLQQAIEMGVKGFTAEKPEGKFTGHVTFGRVQRIKRPQAEMLAKLAFGMTERFFGEWVADKVEMIRSEPGIGGSRYTTLAAIPLQTGNEQDI
jgi:2'-5' RNA ligase